MKLSPDLTMPQDQAGVFPDLVCVLNAEGIFQQVSDTCRDTLGHESRELLGQCISVIMAPESRDAARAQFLQAFQGHAAVNFENACLDKDGQRVYIAWSVLRVAADGLLICVGHNVTARHLRQRQNQHYAGMEPGFDMVALLDEAGRYTYAGGATQQILGYEPAQLIGHRRLDFVHPDDQRLAVAGWAQLAEQSSLVLPYCRFRTADGEWKWLETTVSHYPQRDAASVYVVSSRDVTERKRSSLALAESEQRFQLLFNSRATLALFQSTDGLVLDANPALLDFLGKKRREVLQQPLTDFLPESVHALFTKNRLAAARGRTVQFDAQVQWPGEEAKTLEVIQTPLVVDGDVVGVHSAVRDITDMARAQRVIKQQAEQLTALLESINDAFVALDRTGKLIYINGEGEQLLNISQEGALGVELWTLFPEAAAYCAQYTPAIEAGETVQFETYFKPLRRWFEVRAYPFAEGVSIFFADITKRMEDEKQLRLLALVARNTDNGVVITDAAGNVEWVNEAFVKDTGYELEELLGRPPGARLQGPETDPATVGYIRERLKRQLPFMVTILNYHKSGKKLWLAMHVAPVRNEAGQVTQFVSVQQNITFRKEVEASQAKLTQDLYRHNRDLQQFAYVISHNLRAPLANALGLATVLTRTEKSSALFDKALANLHLSMTQADDVLKDLNQVLSIRDKKDTLVEEPLVINTIILQTIHNLKTSLEECLGQVSLDTSESLVTHGNRAYLYSIFYNLLSNAIKYRAEERPLRVDIACFLGEHGGPTITFADNGSGFNRYKAGSDVFQLYKRFHTNQRGRGIGLFLVKTHVEAMGGKIEVASEVNFGTRFVIHLDKH